MNIPWIYQLFYKQSLKKNSPICNVCWHFAALERIRSSFLVIHTSVTVIAFEILNNNWRELRKKKLTEPISKNESQKTLSFSNPSLFPIADRNDHSFYLLFRVAYIRSKMIHIFEIYIFFNIMMHKTLSFTVGKNMMSP